mgnify:CR=1 FL=1
MFDIQVTIISEDYIRLALDNPSAALTGIAKLTQMVVMNLLTTPGLDPQDPSWGSGLASTMPKYFSDDALGEAEAAAAVALAKCKNDIISTQANVQLDPEERLDTLDLIEVTYNQDLLGWEVSAVLRSASGRITQLGVPLS